MAFSLACPGGPCFNSLLALTDLLNLGEPERAQWNSKMRSEDGERLAQLVCLKQLVQSIANKNYTKMIFMTQIITMVRSLTYNHTSWNVKSSGP